MKKATRRILALIMVLSLLTVGLPLTAHADDSYIAAQRVGFRIDQDGTFAAEWKLDYTGLADDVSVSHTLTFFRSNRYTEQKMFELEQEGRVNEVDLTSYKEWYFGSTEWSYSVQLTTRYSTVENGTTYTTTMSPVKSSSGILFDLKMPDPVLTAVVPAAYREGDPTVAFDISWENLQDDCELQFTLTVNDSETKRFTVKPDNEDMPVNATQTYYMPVTELDTPPAQGDSIRCEVQIYRMVTASNGAPAGDPVSAEIVTAAADPNAPKITGASYPILRQGASTLRLEATWEHKPPEDCVLALSITVNNGQEQRFEVTPQGENAAADGTHSFELAAKYLKKALQAGDRVHTELSFIRDSDSIPLSMPYSFDAVVKSPTATDYAFVMRATAVNCETGEQKIFTLTEEEQRLPAEEQSAALDTKARAWLISAGADPDSVRGGNSSMGMSGIYGDGAELDRSDLFAFMMSSDYDLYDTVTIKCETMAVYLAAKPAVWGDVDCDGAATALDVTWIQRMSAMMDDPASGVFIPFTAEDYLNGDVDQSGDTNILDATLIQYWLAGMGSEYPIGEPTA